jgi:hypothetical protein
MLRKDLRQTLWLPGICILVAAAGGIISLSGWTYGNYSSAQLVEGLYTGAFTFILPFLTFLAGMILFQQEQWRLVWTLPLGRWRVLLEKLAVGFLMGLVGAVLMYWLFHFSIHLEDPIFSGFWLIVPTVAGALLLGALVGLGTSSLPAGILLALGVAMGMGLLGSWLDLWDILRISSGFLGDGLLVFLGVVFLIALVLGVAGLFCGVRLFQPWRNAALAIGLLAGIPAAVLGLDAAMLYRATVINDLRADFFPTNNWLINADTCLLEGRSRKMEWLNAWWRILPKSFGKETGDYRAPLFLLYRFEGGTIHPLDPFCYYMPPEVSNDGTLLALESIRFRGLRKHTLSLEVMDSKGSMRWRFPLPQGEYLYGGKIFWRPDSHEILFIQDGTLIGKDLETGKQRMLPLPTRLPPLARGTDGARETCFYLDPNVLVCLRQSEEWGYEVFRYDPGAGTWQLALEDRIPRKWRQYWSSQIADNPNVFWDRGEWVVLSLVDGRVQAQRVARDPGDPVILTDAGLISLQDGRLHLRDLPGADLRAPLAMPYPECSGFADGNRIFLVNTKAGRDFESTSARFFLLDLAGWKLEELLPSRQSIWFVQLASSHGSVGLVKVYTRHRLEYYRVDLRQSAMRKVLDLELSD